MILKKCVREINDADQKIKLISFPEPETQYRAWLLLYYNFDEGILIFY